jgi:hypothetical protein
LLHGGKQCRSVVATGSEFCPHHTNLIEEHGAEALKRGEHLPARWKRAVQAPVIAKAVNVTTSNGTATADPASVRPRSQKPQPPASRTSVASCSRRRRERTEISGRRRPPMTAVDGTGRSRPLNPLPPAEFSDRAA